MSETGKATSCKWQEMCTGIYYGNKETKRNLHHTYKLGFGVTTKIFESNLTVSAT